MPRILIVEDEDIIRSAVRKLLLHAGFLNGGRRCGLR